MGLEPAGHALRAPSAISADRIFDGRRWHNNAVIVIDRGRVQCITPRNQSADDWLTQVMPLGTVLAPASSTCKSMVAAEFFATIIQRQTRCARLLEHIADTAPLFTYFDKRYPRKGDGRSMFLRPG